MATFNLGDKPVYPPLPTLEEKIMEAIEMVDYVTEKNILKGFSYEVNGTTYQFSYDSSDQINFSQMNSDAILSKQLGAMSEEALIATYGANDDGTLNTDNLPVALPDQWVTAWQGHIYTSTGYDEAYTLTFNPDEFLALSKAGGEHLKSCLSAGWELKAKLRAATDKDNLKQIIKELDLATLYSNAKQGK